MRAESLHHWRAGRGGAVGEEGKLLAHICLQLENIKFTFFTGAVSCQVRLEGVEVWRWRVGVVGVVSAECSGETPDCPLLE